MFFLSAGLFTAASPVAPASVTVPVTLTYAPAPADNPLKGFMPYAGSYPDFPHSMEWFYLPLKDLQTDFDRFDWQKLDDRLNAIAKRGHQAVFRVYLDYPDEDYGVPAFLTKVARHAYTDEGNGKRHTSYSPDYENPDLRRALQHFIAALGKRYDGDARIGFITIGLLGFWGEWHTYPHDSWFASVAVQNEVLDAFEKAFHQTRLLMREPKPGTNAARRAIGYHDDSFAYSTLPPPDWHFWAIVRAQGAVDTWRTQPIGGEVRPEVQPCLWDDTPCTPAGQDFAKCVRTTHASWMLNQGAFNGLSGIRRDRAIAGARRLGYEFFVSQARIGLTSRNALQAALQVRNTGVAPFYYNWKVRVGIWSADRKMIRAWTINGNLPHILPGQPDTLWKLNYNLALRPGTYKLLVQIANPLPGGHPVRFANAEQDRDLSGWLSVGSFEAN